MEKIDILAVGFAITTVILGCYIAYLKVGIKFILEELAKHHICLEKILKNAEIQNKINTAQDEYNTAVRELLRKWSDDYSPTGGQEQSN